MLAVWPGEAATSPCYGVVGMGIVAIAKAVARSAGTGIVKRMWRSCARRDTGGRAMLTLTTSAASGEEIQGGEIEGGTSNDERGSQLPATRARQATRMLPPRSPPLSRAMPQEHSQSRNSANDDHEHMREAETAPFQSKPKTMQRGDHERHTGRVDCQSQRDK